MRHPCSSALVLAVCLIAPLAGMAADTHAAGDPDTPDCRCRAPDGSLKDLGTVQCVEITGQSRLVRCVMSTNTPYWRPVDGVQGCPVT